MNIELKNVIYSLVLILHINFIQASELENKLFNKTYTIQGVFYKYDFADVNSAWDFVYMSYNNNLYYQLKGVNITDKNPFGWKLIPAISSLGSTKPVFHFVYLGDINKDSNTIYNWIAISSELKTAHKLSGKTSAGSFAWSDLSNTSVILNEAKRTVSFYKALSSDGNALVSTDTSKWSLPQFENQPDFFNGPQNDANNSKDDEKGNNDKKDDDTKNDKKDDDKNKNDDTTKNDKKDDSSSDKNKMSDADIALKKECDKTYENTNGDSPPPPPSGTKCEKFYE